MRSIALLVLFVGWLAAGCSSTTDPEITPDYLLLGSQTDGVVTIELYADRALNAGYHTLYVHALRNGATIRDAHIEIAPLMDMGSMRHACPVEQPGTSADSDGMFRGAVIFTMAGTVEQWTVTISLHDHDTGLQHTMTFPVSVEASSYVSVIKDSMSKTVVTLREDAWRTGTNEVDFLVHRTTDGFTYAPMEDLAMTITPTMPSMGHGSEGNADPVHLHNGWYQGSVNFTMTGEWDLALVLYQNEERVADTHYLVQVH